MTIAVGDLVRVTRQEGMWAVMAPLRSPTGIQRWSLSQWSWVDRRSTGLDRGEGDLQRLGHPVFRPGDKALHHGEVVTVLADEGDKVRISIERRMELNGAKLNTSRQPWVDRAGLVAENALVLARRLETS